MNYCHSFHAGNIADVGKHVMLVVLLEALRRKSTPFFYLDTHAGVGIYDLAGTEARRTGEADAGVKRFLAACVPAGAALGRYRDLISGANEDVERADFPRFYPGSCYLAAQLARPSDRLVLAELQPDKAAALQAVFRGDRRVGVHCRDGYEALGAFLPPPEGRGLVFIDPPFEDAREFGFLAGALTRAAARWPRGIFAAWYPLKDMNAVAGFRRNLERSGLHKILDAAFEVGSDTDAPRLRGGGLVIVNPPWQTDAILAGGLRELAAIFGPGAGWDVNWLVPEQDGRPIDK